MEDIENNSKSLNNGFIKHVFNFDNETKSSLLNTGQYVLLAIIPLTIYNHLVNSVIAEFDESKGNVEVLVEIVGELFAQMFGLFFIHRLITYVPTYSGRSMGELNLFTIILIYISVLYQTDSQVGRKIKLLVSRGIEIWEGKPKEEKKGKNTQGKPIVKITQPISRAGMPTHQASRADYLKSDNVLTSPTQMVPPVNEQTTSTNNNMYNSAGFNGLVDANAPVSQAPMAANEGFGAFTKF